jgi:uncharacterized membrane protein
MRRSVVIGLLAAAVVAVVGAPLVAASWGPASWPLYAAFSWICHQRPERSWHLAGYPLAVCVRCLGVYAGALAGALAGRPFSRRWALGAVVLMAGEWLAEAAGLAHSLEGVRFVTGLAAGFFLVPGIWREQKGFHTRIWRVEREVRA